MDEYEKNLISGILKELFKSKITMMDTMVRFHVRNQKLEKSLNILLSTKTIKYRNSGLYDKILNFVNLYPEICSTYGLTEIQGGLSYKMIPVWVNTDY